MSSPRGLTRLQLILITAAWIATVPNAVAVGQFLASPAAGHGLGAAAFAGGGWLFILTATLAFLLAAGLFFPGRGAKILCAIALVAAAAVSYFSTFLGIQFDKTMVTNMLQTHVAEAVELVNFRLLAWVVAIGVVPAIVVWRVPTVPVSWARAGLRALGSLALLVGLTGIAVYAQYPRYASAARNRDITFNLVAPTNVLASAILLAAADINSRTVRAPRGTDAHQAYAIPRPRLLIFVLGETARAQNHGLNGYLRDTTPRMRAAGGYYFADTESCGTATAISVPCIFSGMTRAEFSILTARGNETLIDVVHRAGARVLWIDNDSGCKDVCAHADYRDLNDSRDERWCPEPGNCHDEILLDGLEPLVRSERRDTLVVLHLKGSHGPAYYRRYPAAFERFSPACQSNDLSSCTPAELRNAYDNTILYTDHVVGETIRIADRMSDQFASAVLYVSDHGESLGEAGLFLHGMPYAVAPAEQTRVPLFAWVSKSFLALEHWDTACMARQTLVPRTHDNVYPTVLGFMEIESVEYKPALDLFEPCDPPAGGRPAPAQARR